ncbi:hypothetical protein FD50_GL001847 [Liquorilactobacillus satsumensis DSM 16230 = JCM 12392]|uniref:Uncharacterized protein n=1 Tax=Liquorilactobacillus satsumensis DSM 16230 = JCM 12392 TaxID=1423801 RepID=A0A0R1UZX0_9LACO|nr:hypothetical protein FD50_GL001847 [Liquorilactobacillus satsumensis DSM 16230 = JCM 12392]
MVGGANHEVEIPAFGVWAGNAARETVILLECDRIVEHGWYRETKVFSSQYLG